mmetsp:Transcript_54278/g.151023  ORF Transcript_54278/g.151023 Transcript_54278/m.151023 type:complete len:201 (+) Transcript_54278:530-1132(+)
MARAKASVSKLLGSSPCIRCRACAKPLANWRTSGSPPAKADACISKAPRNNGGKQPQNPKSMNAMWSWPPDAFCTTSMFPLCKSPWKTASLSITDNAATLSARIKTCCNPTSPLCASATQNFDNGTPMMRSMVRTLDALACRYVSGTRTLPTSLARRRGAEFWSHVRNASMFRRSKSKLHSSNTAQRSSSTHTSNGALKN